MLTELALCRKREKKNLRRVRSAPGKLKAKIAYDQWRLREATKKDREEREKLLAESQALNRAAIARRKENDSIAGNVKAGLRRFMPRRTSGED